MTRTEHMSTPSRNVLYISLIVILGAAYFLLTYNGVFFAPDEGASVYHFERVAEGAIQHRDFYSVYGMAYYILGKTLFQLFGFNLMVMRKFVLLVKLAVAILIYCVGIRLMRPSFAFLGALGFVIWWGDPFIATPTLVYPAQVGQALGLLSVLFFLMSLKNNRDRFVLLAGMAAGLSSLFKPNVGVFNLLALHFFVFERETLRDLVDSPPDSTFDGKRPTPSFGKIGIALEMGGILVAAVVLYTFLAKFGFDFATFAFALLPFYLTIAYLLLVGIRALQTQGKAKALRENHWHAIRSHALLIAGFLVWQLAQVAYFWRNGSLGDFFRMLTTATRYYSFYALPLWQGTNIIITVITCLLIAGAFKAVMTKAPRWNASAKILLVVIALALLSLLPVAWYLGLSRPSRLHFLVRAVLLSFSFLVCLYLSHKENLGGGSGKDTSQMPVLSLVTIFAAVNLLDAFPKTDPGHIVMVMPPFFILFGILAQRFYDSFRELSCAEFPAAGKRIAGVLTCVLALGIMLPSLFMMTAFNILLVPSPNGSGWSLYEGRLTPVPRYPAGIERAKGMAIHTFVSDGTYWPPLVDPKTIDLFTLAKRLPAITRKEDRLFSTMSSALMLYFLADRDSVSDKANCYIWQTDMGTTTSEEIPDFSDMDLTRIIDRERPAAVITENGSTESELFARNWPSTWNFIMSHYVPAEQVGPFQILVPER